MAYRDDDRSLAATTAPAVAPVLAPLAAALDLAPSRSRSSSPPAACSALAVGTVGEENEVEDARAREERDDRGGCGRGLPICLPEDR